MRKRPRKETSPGWPDPTEWLNRLCTELEHRNSLYLQEPDVLLRRNKAAAMLGAVLSALHELPAVNSKTSHLPLKDLLIFLSDLDRGKAHPWVKTGVFGINTISSAELELRHWAIGMVHILWATGLGKGECYKAVANGLTKHGRHGKDGGPVPWRSVQQWCRDLGDPSESLIGKRMLDWWQVHPCPHDFLLSNCPSSEDSQGQCVEAQSYARHQAEDLWDLPHLRDRFG